MGWPKFRVMPLTKKRRARLIKCADLDDRDERMLLNELSAVESSVQQLADNPLFLSLLCEYVRDKKSTPESNHAVLGSYVQSRLERDQERIETRFAVTIDVTRNFAEEMAFQMLSSPKLGLSASKAQIVECVTRHLNQDVEEGMAAIDALIYSKLARFSDDDLSREPQNSAVTFSHRRLQEYFATCVVIKERTRIRANELLTNGRWRETAVAVLQTQLPENSAELFAEADVLLRAGFTTLEGTCKNSNTTRRSIWPPGVLHVLDLLVNGVKPDLSSQLPVSATAAQILETSWQHGNRLDKKWVVELCASTGTERAIDYLARAFDSESLWLRDQAYVQVRRIGTAASRLEPQIRQMLIDMSIGGGLRRERKSVHAQLLRLSNPQPLQRVAQLILAAPVVAAIAGVLTASILSLIILKYEFYLFYRAYPLGMAILAIFLIMPSVFLARFALASKARAQRYTRGFLAKVGLSRGAKKIASCLSFCFLFFALILVLIISGHFGIMVGLLLAWLLCWPYAALFSAANGIWTERRYWLILPLYFGRRAVDLLRKYHRLIVTSALSGAIFAALFSRIAAVIGGNWLWFTYYAVLGVPVLGFLWGTLRRAWQRHRDSCAVSALAQWDADQQPVRNIQQILDALQTDEGVQLLLREMRKRELQRHAEVAEFLAFLSLCLERSSSAPGGEENEPANEHSQRNWVTWWTEYHRSDHAKPLLAPSSESIDELGRALEDAQRSAAFHS